MVNKKRLIKLTQELIKINSENPPGKERKIAEYVFSFLKIVSKSVWLRWGEFMF